MLLDVLMEYDVVTVSGLADGVDQCIHGGSLDRGIPTIAILGG
jgi:predicted Rossmann fold nucleotide-binding protein DprA/Smf involved in DNA uptake